MSAAEWIADFNAAMASFVAERPIVACSVRITFGDGLSVMVKTMSPGPTPTSILIDPYPEDMGSMVKRADGQDATPSRILVEVHSIYRVEFLVEPPEASQTGFTPPSD